MSEHITHIAAFEDITRLALHSGAINDVFKQTLTRHYDTGLCGGASSGGGSPGSHRRITVPVIERARAHSGELPDDNEILGRQLAFVLGWLTHAAADATLDVREKYRAAGFTLDSGETATAEGEQPPIKLTETEKQVYNDAVLFDKVYDGGRRKADTPHEPLSPATLEENMHSHPGAALVNVEHVEPLFGVLWQVELLKRHRFASEEDDFDQWLETFFERRQEFMEDLRSYVEAFQNPDPEKMKYYIEEMNFYAETDPIIRLARSIQQGQADTSIDLAEAVEAAESQSSYAQALGKGYRYFQKASDLFEGAIDRNEMYAVLGIAE